MAQSSNFAASCFVVVMVILAALTCEARSSIRVQEVVQKSGSAEIQHHHVLSSGISTASQPDAGVGAAVNHDSMAPKSIELGACSFVDIGITNNPVAPAATWEVQITNQCQCPVSNLLLNCPHFSTGVRINPARFKINGDGTCLVNNGQALGASEMIFFKYMEVYKENLWVRSATFGC